MAIAIGVVARASWSSPSVLVHRQVFGEMMMFVYYACLTPLSRRIGRGFYEDGIWADSSFIPFNEIGGITGGKSEQQVTLVDHLAIAQSCTPSEGPDRQVQCGAPPVA